MDLTNFDAIEFYNNRKKQIRVYYQTKDKAIRESSFNEDGWFTDGDGIVTEDAKAKSPITVTRWNTSSEETQIRIYFLDEKNNICERKGKYDGSITHWEASAILKSAAETNITSGSQLAVARPDTDDDALRLFYQEKDKESYICELRFRKQGKWVIQGTQISGAKENSRLSAISDRKSVGVVRLYYQGQDGRLWESYWDTAMNPQTKFVQKKFILVTQAPISAVSWYANGKLQIRVYTALQSNNKSVAQISYNEEEGGWDEDVKNIASLQHDTSSVTASRDTNAGSDHAISIFHQPSPTVIDFSPVPASDAATDKAVADKVITPKGIPTSRGASTSRRT